MKRIEKILLAFISGLSVVGCFDSFDKPRPQNLVPADKVWNDPAAIKSVMANLYSRLVIEDWNYFYGHNTFKSLEMCTFSDEASAGFMKAPAFDQGGATWEYPDDYLSSFRYVAGILPGTKTPTYNLYSYSYGLIRDCNEFLQHMSEASLDVSQLKESEGEARFIRAYTYFQLVKRYGGVPLITEAQKYHGDLVELCLPRETEEAIWDYVLVETEAAANCLPEIRTNDKLRLTRGAALALRSRAALYAGSIAKYGKVGFGRLTGIPPEQAERFYEVAYQASKAVIESGRYKLFDQIPDRTENFYQLFMAHDNPEYIFQRNFDVGAHLTHSYDKTHYPYSWGRWGIITPTLEMVEAFEYLDGSKGVMDTKKQYSDIRDAFKGKDPRFLASVHVPGDVFGGDTIQFLRGLILKDGTKRYTQTGSGPHYAPEKVIDPSTKKEYLIKAKDGGAYTGDGCKTGFHMRKFLHEGMDLESIRRFDLSDTPFPVFRLAEMYLNLAEAAIEMGRYEEDAKQALNAIRIRAGMPELEFLDIAKVRQERRVELAFEGHRTWDMRRWRISHLDAEEGGLNGFVGSGYHPFYDVRTNRYQFEKAMDLPKRTRIYTEKNYYMRFSSADMNSNPSLIQNPGFIN